MNEFDCAECGTQVWRAIPLTPTEIPLCSTCVCVPGWLGDDAMRQVLDPDGRCDPERVALERAATADFSAAFAAANKVR